MKLETGTFFAMVAALAAGGVAGHYATKKGLLPNGAPAEPAPAVAVTPPPPAASSAVQANAIATAPSCDDTVGTAGECPPIGYSAEEGGCGNFTNKRCKEFKEALKPRVATVAVECIARLTPAQKCEPFRVNLCGHLSLANACSVSEITQSGAASSREAQSVGAMCEAIRKGCGGAGIAPSELDCRQTLAGMTEMGRSRMLQCMNAHCSDKGLLGCEAVADAKPQG
jgi:hypothetical protein